MDSGPTSEDVKEVSTGVPFVGVGSTEPTSEDVKEVSTGVPFVGVGSTEHYAGGVALR